MLKDFLSKNDLDDIFSKDLKKEVTALSVEDLLNWNKGVSLLAEMVDGVCMHWNSTHQPWKELSCLFKSFVTAEDKQISRDIVASHIKSIYAKRNGIDDWSMVWNDQDKVHPKLRLMRYTPIDYIGTLKLFYKYPQIAKDYLSMNFAFDYSFIKEHWSALSPGEAFYRTYISQPWVHVYQPKLGLSFNTNIRWNSKMRAKYNYGYFCKYEGKYIGLHRSLDIEDIDFMDDILPLKKERLIEDLQSFEIFAAMSLVEDLDTWEGIPELAIIHSSVGPHPLQTADKWIKKSSLAFLLHPQLWNSYFYYVVDRCLCYSFLLNIEENKK